MKAGKHTITFENAEEGLTKTLEVDVAAGRDLLGGQFLAGRGTGRIAAQGQVAAAASNSGVGEAILAQMGGASWRVEGRDSVALAGSFNPTAAAAPSASPSADPLATSSGTAWLMLLLRD